MWTTPAPHHSPWHAFPSIVNYFGSGKLTCLIKCGLNKSKEGVGKGGRYVVLTRVKQDVLLTDCQYILFSSSHHHKARRKKDVGHRATSVRKGSDGFCVLSTTAACCSGWFWEWEEEESNGALLWNNNFQTVIMRQPLREKEFITKEGAPSIWHWEEEVSGH